jgi:hypothetical protein
VTRDRILLAAKALRENAEALRESHMINGTWDDSESGQEAQKDSNQWEFLAWELEELASNLWVWRGG